MVLSEKVAAIAPSLTLSITAKAKQMKQEGISVIGFGAGEPDFNTPDYIIESAKHALDIGFTKYTPASGMPELKEAIVRKFKEDNGLTYAPGQIVVSCGAKSSLYHAIASLLNDGDEVLIPSPYWLTYPELVRLAGGVSVFVPAKKERDYKVTAEDLARHTTAKTKLLILNSPNNPTGAVYTREELSAIAAYAEKAGIYVISDEIYEYLVYDGAEHVSIASLGDEIKARTITINGMSKAYAMTGWRIGYTASPVEVAKAMTNYQSHSTSNPNSIAQYAALAALSGPDTQLKSMVAEFDRRRRRIVELINGIPGLSCIPPKGAFYVMMNISGLFGKKLNGEAIVDSMSFTRLLLEDSKVAVVPGIGFGADSFVRLSYATNMANIEKGLSRIADFVSRLTD